MLTWAVVRVSRIAQVQPIIQTKQSSFKLEQQSSKTPFYPGYVCFVCALHVIAALSLY